MRGKVKDLSEDPFFLKKAKEAIAFIKKYRLPRQRRNKDQILLGTANHLISCTHPLMICLFFSGSTVSNITSAI